MSSVAPGSSSLLFHRKDEIVDHLLKNILANQNRYIGTEWEMFFVKPEFFTDPKFFSNPHAKSFTRADGQKAFAEFKRVYELMGYSPQYIREKTNDRNRIVGLKIPGHGSIIPEAGYQFEYAASVSNNCDEVREKNEEAYRAILEVTKRLNLTAVFKGHIPGYAEKTEGMDRSRGEEWRNYYRSSRFDAETLPVLREAQDGTASVQVTIDAGADKFHEFYKALLLIEPALTLYYTNSNRSYVGMRAYGEIIPTQVEPIVNVWQASTPREALSSIVERLMDIEVPFLPHPELPGIYKAEPLVNSRPPTVKDLMKQGRLSEQTLNNIGSFFYTRPAFKNFSQALLEVRGVDSQPNPDTVTEVAQRVANLIYNDDARRKLLEDYAHLTPSDIQKLHRASTIAGKEEAFRIQVAGTQVGNFVNDIISRSETGTPQMFTRPATVNRVLSGQFPSRHRPEILPAG